MKPDKRAYSIVIGIGALLWIVVGVLMSLREPGNNAGKYRMTYDLLPFAGLGMLLITSAVAHLLWQYRAARMKWVRLICYLDVLAGAVFVTGGIMVANDHESFPFMLFSGYMLSLTGLILSGVAGFKGRLFSSVVSYILIGMGGSLLFFNDQYTPWVACILGSIALWLAYLLWARPQHFSSPSLSTD